MQKAYKYRLYPTKVQETILEQMLEECRWLYNKILETRKNAWEQRQESLGNYDTMTMIPGWKTERRSLKSVHSQVLQNVNVRVDLAFKAFFRRIKAGEEPGYPCFKGKGWYDSLTYPQYGNGVRLDAGAPWAKLSLSKLGQVKLVLHRPLCGTPNTVTIRHQSGKWYACFSCECELEPLPETETAVGVDVGLTSFATLSNGEKVDNPRFFRKDEKALAKAQRKLSKCQKGTPERAKARKVVGRIHERIANHRRDFAHKLSRQLVNTFGLIAFENLNIKNMLKNGHLSKSIADAAWNQLVQYTTYKAESAGRHVVLVDPRNTSQRCSKCGSIVQKSLSVRIHDCPVCGLVIDRDENAAINILALGLQGMGESPRSPSL
jgi:putative transposase